MRESLQRPDIDPVEKGAALLSTKQDDAIELDAIDAIDITKIQPGALAIREDQYFWTDEQLAVLRSLGVERHCPKAELANFLHLCQKRRLDPFLKQVYLIGRFSEVEQRYVWSPQTSIDAFRLIARRAADSAGIDYGYEDPVYVDDQGKHYSEWVFDWPPAAVKWVTVRNGQRFPAQARYGAYVQITRHGQPNRMWKTMPDVLLGKCSEALSLRMAFPEDLGGIFTFDEMGQAHNTTPYRPPQGAAVVQGQAERVDQPQPETPPEPEARRGPASRPGPSGDPQLLEKMTALLVQCGMESTPAQLAVCTALLGESVASLDHLATDQIKTVGSAAQYAAQQPSPKEALTAVMGQAMKQRRTAA